MDFVRRTFRFTSARMRHWSYEETDDPLYADQRNFYKVEQWSKDGLHIEEMLYAGNNLDKARAIFNRAVRRRPRIRLIIRQRTRVLEQWPHVRRTSYRRVLMPMP